MTRDALPEGAPDGSGAMLAPASLEPSGVAADGAPEGAGSADPEPGGATLDDGAPPGADPLGAALSDGAASAADPGAAGAADDPALPAIAPALEGGAALAAGAEFAP